MSKEKLMQNSLMRLEPEAFLEVTKAEEKSKRGKLKIFLGYSAGVGKTYAMLEAITHQRQEGVDAVIAYVETHQRKETEALLGGAEVMPRITYSYRGTVLEEMDLDAVLKRKPRLAAVDELAHTNAPEARHPKRYQDVQEILNAGIDIYTTLNIQHLESLNDIIAKITGVKMRETIPDTVLQEADEIEVIDIPIGELLKRFQEGKVYVPDQALTAIQHFFNEGNLTALRELTLRRAAKSVDAQMQGYIQRRAIVGPWPSQERLLVCVSSYETSTELVRAGSLLATGLDAQWSVIYIESLVHYPRFALDHEHIAKTLEFAQELGARIVTLTGENIASEILNYAIHHNVTKIIIGKPLKKPWYSFYKNSLVDEIILNSGDIDVHVISCAANKHKKEKKHAIFSQSKSPWNYYLNSITLVIIASIVGKLLSSVFSEARLILVYILAVLMSAVWWGRRPSILAAVLGVIAFDCLFVPPYFSFDAIDKDYLLNFAVLLIVGLVISSLAEKIRFQTDAVRQRERRTSTLYGLSRDLSKAIDIYDVYKASIKHIGQSFECSVALLFKEKNILVEKNIQQDFPWSSREKAVAAWVLQNGEEAGWGTDTLPAAAAIYFPLITNQVEWGVLGIHFKDPKQKIVLDDKKLLESFISQISIAIERIHLVDEARQIQVMREKEVIQTALFDSISHDLRTPLITIKDLLNALLEGQDPEDKIKKDILETAYEETLHMNQLIENLLDMARLETEAFKLSFRGCDINKLINSVLIQFEGCLSHRKVSVQITENLPLIFLDEALMFKVLTNTIDNAIRYSNIDQSIDIQALVSKTDKNYIEIYIADKGLGIPKEDLEQIFDKFYRVKRPQIIEGTGLGLSICKHIIEAHKGRIWAENRPNGGSTFVISLPINNPV